MIIFLIFFFTLTFGLPDRELIPDRELFAGNGLKTSAHTLLHDRIIEMNCTTYDDCYDLLCAYMFDGTVYDITVTANDWDGDCHQLNSTDNRLLSAEFYTNNQTYQTETVSDASILLCMLNRKSNGDQIDYFGFNCTF